MGQSNSAAKSKMVETAYSTFNYYDKIILIITNIDGQNISFPCIPLFNNLLNIFE